MTTKPSLEEFASEFFGISEETARRMTRLGDAVKRGNITTIPPHGHRRQETQKREAAFMAVAVAHRGETVQVIVANGGRDDMAERIRRVCVVVGLDADDILSRVQFLHPMKEAT